MCRNGHWSSCAWFFLSQFSAKALACRASFFSAAHLPFISGVSTPFNRTFTVTVWPSQISTRARNVSPSITSTSSKGNGPGKILFGLQPRLSAAIKIKHKSHSKRAFSNSLNFQPQHACRQARGPAYFPQGSCVQEDPTPSLSNFAKLGPKIS